MWGAQGLLLGSLLRLIYINNLHILITYSKLHHFADDTDFLNINNRVKSFNKKINYDPKNVADWLKINKFPLYIGKTELLLFTSPKNNLTAT